VLLTPTVFVSSAFAARGHEFEKAFGGPCLAEPCGPGELKEPDGVGVNEATGDVYVVDKKQFVRALAVALEAPETKTANEVRATTAVLDGVLNPKVMGEPGTYEFLYKGVDS
jgi:hypothetical protein